MSKEEATVTRKVLALIQGMFAMLQIQWGLSQSPRTYPIRVSGGVSASLTFLWIRAHKYYKQYCVRLVSLYLFFST